MRNVISIITLLTSLAVPARAGVDSADNEKLISALAILSGDPSRIDEPEHAEAWKVVVALWKPHLHKLELPDEATQWVPQSGPCGGPGSPLLSAFVASVSKDKLLGNTEGSIYRGWLVAIRHYQYFRKTEPDNFPAISSLEQMIKDEAEDRLREKAAVIEKLPPKRQETP